MSNLRGLLVLFASLFLLVACEKEETRQFETIDRLPSGIFLEPEQRLTLPEGKSIRKVYDKGVDLIKVSEGFRERLYNDAAQYCTIAYGHLVKLAPCDGSEPLEFRKGVTEPRGTEILKADMEKAELAVMSYIDVELTDGQYAALTDFVYNVGSGNFRKSTLRKVVNAGNFDNVPFQFRRWVKAGGKVLEGLKRRREEEIKLFFDGMMIPRALPAVGEDLTEIDIRMGE